MAMSATASSHEYTNDFFSLVIRESGTTQATSSQRHQPSRFDPSAGKRPASAPTRHSGLQCSGPCVLILPFSGAL
jgi:hypothetical protein